MSKQEVISALTWKYFWEQKINELGKFFSWVIIGVFLPYFVGSVYGFTPEVDLSPECFGMLVWLAGFMTILFLYGIFMLASATLKDWIQSNWKKASSRAKKEYNRR